MGVAPSKICSQTRFPKLNIFRSQRAHSGVSMIGDQDWLFSWCCDSIWDWFWRDGLPDKFDARSMHVPETHKSVTLTRWTPSDQTQNASIGILEAKNTQSFIPTSLRTWGAFLWSSYASKSSRLSCEQILAIWSNSTPIKKTTAMY